MVTGPTATSRRVGALLVTSNGFVDAYTYLAHGGVFANAQTGNVILFGVGLAKPGEVDALTHLWPVIAFVVGIVVANLFRGEAATRQLHYPLRYVLGLQALVLVAVGLLPASAPEPSITTSIGFVAALQFSLFRSVRTATVVPVAMTGNLMRTTDAVLTALRGRRREDVVLAVLYVSLVLGFGAGAVVGALVTGVVGTRAVWIPAAMIVVALVLFFIDEPRHPAPSDDKLPADDTA
ncbi:MAG: hypothetical protein QOC83_4208 [Pseudonocardiales bacterium]|nr:hypothetical protein [Pseudonocardiales bacterium]